MNKNKKNFKKNDNDIQSIGITNDNLTGRAGLAFIWKYIKNINIVKLLSDIFKEIRKSRKGREIEQIIKQLLCFFIDGSKFSITRFDELAKDNGYKKIIGVNEEEIVSSHIIKRFFNACEKGYFKRLQDFLIKMFIWRLKIEKPKVIILGLDTMVLDNNEAKKREGVNWTYKKVAGYHPVHIYWKEYIVSLAFHEGSQAPNYNNDTNNLLNEVIKRIRKEYSKKVPIIIVSDSGFFDQKYFKMIDEMKRVFFICGGKIYDSIKLKMLLKLPEEWERFEKGEDIIEYVDFRDKRDSWDREYRVIYTRHLCENEEYKLLFDMRESIIYTNIEDIEELKECGIDEYINGIEIIKMYHNRGKDELVNRGIKEFVDESLPFKNFVSNGVYYFLSIIAYNIFIAFKVDKLSSVLPIESYPQTIRRIFIDIAGKIVNTGRKIILKIRKEVNDRYKLIELWENCDIVVQI